MGAHQGSVLRPLLFIIVLEALSLDFRVGAPWELYFADDLVITTTSLEECVDVSRFRNKEWSQKGSEYDQNYVNGLWDRSGCPPGLF